MPYFFEFEPAQSALRCTMSGQIADAHLLDCHKIFVRLARQKDPNLVILDLTSVSLLNVSPATVQRLARTAPVLPPMRRRFIIAPGDHLYGMSRMYQLIGESIRPGLQVVRSLAEAYAAAGIRDLRFEPISES